MNHISNARQPGESFKNYRTRLRVINKAVKLAVRGRLSHESSRVLILAPVGEDPKIDEAFTNDLQRGLIRDVVHVPMKVKKMVDGKPVDSVKILRHCRTKGVTKLHPSKKLNPTMKRAERRKLYKRNEWRAAA